MQQDNSAVEPCTIKLSPMTRRIYERGDPLVPIGDEDVVPDDLASFQPRNQNAHNSSGFLGLILEADAGMTARAQHAQGEFSCICMNRCLLTRILCCFGHSHMRHGISYLLELQLHSIFSAKLPALTWLAHPRRLFSVYPVQG